MNPGLCLQFQNGVRLNQSTGVVELDNPIVTQAAHGFVLGGVNNNIPIPAFTNALGNVVAAQADNINTLSYHFVAQVLNVNEFLVVPGDIFWPAPAHGLIVGETYFLSETVAGGFTNTPAVGQISDPVFLVHDANTLLLLGNRPFDEQSFLPYAIKVRNTDITTNLNAATTDNAIPLNGSLAFNESTDTYTPSGNGIQVLRDDGYTVKANVHVFSASTRQASLMRLHVNGAPIGDIAATGYIRNTTGHNEASYHIDEELTLNALDIVTVEFDRESTAGGAMNLALVGSSSLMIKRRRV